MTTDENKRKDAEHVFCAHCGTENPTDVYSCDRCGEKIYFPDPLKPPPMGIVECQNCLNANESRASYCVQCGEPLTNAARISILGASDPARQAPHSPPGGIRMRQRDQEPGAPSTRTPEQDRPVQRPPTESQPPRNDPSRTGTTDPPVDPAVAPEARVREPKQEREQREAARDKVAEQERLKAESSQGENDSGTKSGRLPKTARGWNTAAFLIGPIWGPANGVWLGVVGLVFFVVPESVIPIGIGLKVTLYLAYGVFLGFRGDEMAWRAKRWPSLEHFRRIQQQWMLAALVINISLVFILSFVLR